MRRVSQWIVLISLVLVVFGPLAPGQNTRRRTHKAAPPKAILPPLPSGPLPQVPMDQIPAAAPQVNYQDGLLSIVAQNSSLSDILREVHKRTGASIDVPANATERVVTRLGPAPPRDVLANLLNGSAFNYVMMGSAADPTGLSSVTLTAKTAGGAGAPVNTATAYQPNQGFTPPERVPPPQPVVIQQAQAQGDEADDSTDEQDAEDNADEDQAQQPGQLPGGANAVVPQDGQQPNAGPKTPEQILEMLRRPQQQPGQPVQPINPNQQPPEQN